MCVRRPKVRSFLPCLSSRFGHFIWVKFAVQQNHATHYSNASFHNEIVKSEKVAQCGFCDTTVAAWSCRLTGPELSSSA